jgi:hypothetical protein
MGPKGALRQVRAGERRLEREAQRRRRELERLEKENAKLSALEQARLEVEAYENQLDVLLSVHKEPCEKWDWAGLAAALPGPVPVRNQHHELRARQLALVAYPPTGQETSAIDQARALAERECQEATETHAREAAEMEAMRELAHRVLAGESMAFLEAFAELNPVAEISSVGSLERFAIERKDLIECVFRANVAVVIPSEVKTLTSTGKLSKKPMPKSQFHELYQDYLCGCVLRMACEVFAMLPVKMLLITAQADVIDALTGQSAEVPVLSVAMPREIVASLDIESVSAVDAIDRFVHRGDFRASRKAGAFRAIVPLTPADLEAAPVDSDDVHAFRERIRALREQIRPS